MMRITKSTYLFFASALILSFWDLRIITTTLNRDIILSLSLFWSIIGYYIPFKKRLPKRNFNNYKWIWITIFSGIFISMFNAYLFWKQPLSTTFIAQRFIYVFILFPTLLYIQPSFSDVFNALKQISIVTLICWILGIFSPTLFSRISEAAIENRKETLTTDIGYYTTGISLVALYTYYLIQSYLIDFSYKKFFKACLWVLFIILYQNRSMMIGIIIIFIYSLFKIKTKHKNTIVLITFILILIGIYHTSTMWMSLLDETQTQLSDEEYNRWKAFHYYLNNYAPNLWCFIFGSGMPSGGNSELGYLYWQNMENGIFFSDLGLMGTWAVYGILPIIVIYSIIAKIIFTRTYPFILKFMSFHILIIPTIFYLNNGEGTLLFIFLFYLYVYSTEINKRHTIC